MTARALMAASAAKKSLEVVIATSRPRDYVDVDAMAGGRDSGQEPVTLLGNVPAEVITSETASPSIARGPVDLDSEPFETFFRREMPRLVALARALSGSAAADDHAQEAMLAAYRRWSEVSRYERPEAWVRRVCANHATSSLRRRGTEARALLRLASQPPAPDQELDDQNEVFWDEVRRLPRRQAQAAALRYLYDLSIAEIAETMNVSEGSVKVHLTRARAVLAGRLDPEVTS